MKRGEEGVYLGFLAWVAMAVLAIHILETAVTARDYIQAIPGALNQPGPLGSLMALWAVALLLLLRQVRPLEKKPLSSSLKWVLGVGIVLIAAVFAWVKPITASDPTYYVAFGRQIVALGVSPYTTLLRDCTQDPIINQVRPMWFNVPCLYGPAGLAPFVLGNLISPKEELLTICSTIRLLYLPMLIATAVVLCKSWRRSLPRWTLTLAVMANPFYLHLAINSGHLEAWMMLWLACVCLFLLKDRPIPAALAFSAACATKIVPIVLTPIYACWCFRRSPALAAKFLAYFGLVHNVLYFALDGADYPGVLRSPDGWNNMAVTGGPIIKAFLAFSLSEFAASRLGILVFFLGGGALCLWILSGRCRLNLYALCSVTLALLCFSRTACTAWYTLWYWPLLWLAYRTERNAMLSIATWSAVLLARIGGLDWVPMIWLITAGYCWNLWLLWREGTAIDSDSEPDAELPARPTTASSHPQNPD